MFLTMRIANWMQESEKISVNTIFNYVYNFESLILLIVATIHHWTNLVGNMRKLQVMIALSHQYRHFLFQQYWEMKRCH